MRPALIPALCLALLLCSPPVRAARAIPQVTASYGIYAGGLHALDATLIFNRGAADYGVTLDATPYGVIGNLLPWGGHFTVHGTVKDGTIVPQNFDKLSQWRGDRDSDSFVYENGVLTSQTETDNSKTPPEKKSVALDPALTKDSVDILTGTVQLLQQVDAGKSCDFSTVIYDGKRRYTLKFTDKGSENLTANAYNSFTGPAKICEIEMIPLAGFPKKPKGYYKIQEEARARGQLPRVWLGHSWGYAGQDGPYIPVKMMVKSEYGAVLIHLQKTTR